MTFKKSMLFAALASLFLSTNAHCPRKKKDRDRDATAAASGRRSATEAEAPAAECSVRRDEPRPFFEVLEANLNTLNTFMIGCNSKDQKIVTDALIYLWPSKNGLGCLDTRIKWNREPQPFTHYAFAIGFLCGRPDSTCIPHAHGLYKMLLETDAEESDTLLSFVDGFLEGSAFKHAITIQDKQWSLSKANRSVQEDYMECLTTFKTKPFSEGVDKHARSQKEILEGSDLRRLTTGNYLLNLGAIAWGAAYRTSLLRAEARLTSEKRGECWNMTYYRWRVEHITKMLFGAGAVIPDELALTYLSPLERIPSAVAERSPTATASAGTTRVHINTSNDPETILFDEMLAAAMTRGPNLTVGDMPVTIIEAIAADSGALHDTLVKNAITSGARTPASTTSSSNASRGLLDNPASATEIAAKRKAEKLELIAADKEKKAEKTRARQAAEAERNARRIDRDKAARAAEKEAQAKATQEEAAKKLTVRKQNPQRATPAPKPSTPKVALPTEFFVAPTPVAPKPEPVAAAAACEDFTPVLTKAQKKELRRPKEQPEKHVAPQQESKPHAARSRQKPEAASAPKPSTSGIRTYAAAVAPTPKPKALQSHESAAACVSLARVVAPTAEQDAAPAPSQETEASRSHDATPAPQQHEKQPELAATTVPAPEPSILTISALVDPEEAAPEPATPQIPEPASTRQGDLVPFASTACDTEEPTSKAAEETSSQEQDKQEAAEHLREASEKTAAAPQYSPVAVTNVPVTPDATHTQRKPLRSNAPAFASTRVAPHVGMPYVAPGYLYPQHAYAAPHVPYAPYIPAPYGYNYGTVPPTYYPAPAPWIQPQAPTESAYDAGWRAGRDLSLNREVEAADKHMALKRAECCATSNVNLDFNRGFIDGYASCQAAPSTK